MTERKGAVTMKGNPLTLIGNSPAVGQPAPGFTIMNVNLEPVSLSDFAGKTVVIASVPSLDTPVCDTETRTFNQKAAQFGPDVVILTISMDLPFAQKRWCGAAGVDQVVTLSDYKDASFGEGWGVLISELRLLARAVFVVDKGGILRYAHLVKEVTDEPEYEKVLSVVRELTS